MSGWKGIVDAFAKALAENLSALKQPQLNGFEVGDGVILFGQQHVREHGGPPRVVLVADGWGWAGTRVANPASQAVPRGPGYAASTQSRSLATMNKKFVVHAWACRYTGAKPDADPDGGDLDALDQLVRAIVISAHYLTLGVFSLTDGRIVTSQPKQTQRVRLGAYATFGLSLGTPVEDLPLGGTASNTVKPKTTTGMIPLGGGTPETGCSTG